MFFRMIFDYSKGLQNCDVNSLIIRNIVGILDNDIFELLDIMSSSYDNIIIIIMIIIIIIIIIILLLLLLLLYNININVNIDNNNNINDININFNINNAIINQ